MIIIQQRLLLSVINNSCLIQWGKSNVNLTTLPTSYSNTNYTVLAAGPNNLRTSVYWCGVINNSQISLYITDDKAITFWVTLGY